MKEKADIGLVGLAVMGENLVLNMESKGFTVACFNRTVSVQKSPDVGVAHMIPEDWDEPRGATGDIGMWSPGG